MVLPFPMALLQISVDDAVKAAKKMKDNGSTLFVVKAMIHAGGRGKGRTKNSDAKALFFAKPSTK